MFIYLVAAVATIFLIFGLLHIRCLPAVAASLNSDLEERPVTFINDRVEFEDLPTHRTVIDNKGRLADALLEEGGSKPRTATPTRYSLEDIVTEERDKDIGLPTPRTLKLGKTQEDAIRTTKQDGKENIFETLKSSIEKTSPYSSSRLNTRQIYNLLLNETLKENEVRQKLLENEKNKLKETGVAEMREQLPSSSENKAEQEDSNSK